MKLVLVSIVVQGITKLNRLKLNQRHNRSRTSAVSSQTIHQLNYSMYRQQNRNRLWKAKYFNCIEILTSRLTKNLENANLTIFPRMRSFFYFWQRIPTIFRSMKKEYSLLTTRMGRSFNKVNAKFAKKNIAG